MYTEYMYTVYIYSDNSSSLGNLRWGGGGGKIHGQGKFNSKVTYDSMIKVGKSVIPRFGVILTEKSISFIIFMIQFQGQICNKNKIFNK